MAENKSNVFKDMGKHFESVSKELIGINKSILKNFLDNLENFSNSIEDVEKNYEEIAKKAAPLFSYLNDKSGKNIVYYVYKPFLEQLRYGIDTLSKEIKKVIESK
jgi:archaellum component FlaC